MTTIGISITDKQIRALREEAIAAGDYAQHDICQRALTADDATIGDDGNLMALADWTQEQARAECARVIADENSDVTTYAARWGSDTVAVAANWSQASESICGLDGRQVADFGHDGRRALRAALEACAADEGMPAEEREEAIDEAMATMTRRPGVHVVETAD